jgi:hypothetical protein
MQARRVLLAPAVGTRAMSAGGLCCSDAASFQSQSGPRSMCGYLAVEQFVTQFTVEAFAIAVPPLATRFDVKQS